jgi:ribosomal-protein-alanine N-acetyltransferase
MSIETERMTLEPASAEFLQALHDAHRGRAEQLARVHIAGDWFEGAFAWMRLRIRQLTDDPTMGEWLVHLMVLRDEARTMVGHCGYHARPDATGMVEIGYQVAPPYRRQGYAIEAVRGLIENAFAHPDVTRVRACISPSNEASLGLIAQLGFLQVGEQMDEVDGRELVFERPRDIPQVR